jgi:5-formyltetrahydrofolate cyclo-ligase
MNDRDAYASPACSMHEVDATYIGFSPIDPAEAVIGWRKAERERLICQRLAIPADQRGRHSEQIAKRLDELVGDPAGLVISAYWPFRGEPDLRAWLDRIAMRGARTALPVVIRQKQPLLFRVWRPGDPLERGVWNIPVPSSKAESAIPELVIAPIVGFDRDGYRLGYGGGFFDRTLAALPVKPRVFGVGYSQFLLPTIYPQPHDIRMDLIVTETGVVSKVAIPISSSAARLQERAGQTEKG